MTALLTRLGLLGLMAMSLSACTAKGPAYRPDSAEPTATTGVIYVYRPGGTVTTRGESPFVTIAGKSYGAIKAGSYIAANLPEGDVKVVVQQSMFLLVPTIPRWVTVTVVAGGTSYVRVDQKISGADFSGGVTVNQSITIDSGKLAAGHIQRCIQFAKVCVVRSNPWLMP
jgi:predicted small lipoprotein YifL